MNRAGAFAPALAALVTVAVLMGAVSYAVRTNPTTTVAALPGAGRLDYAADPPGSLTPLSPDFVAQSLGLSFPATGAPAVTAGPISAGTGPQGAGARTAVGIPPEEAGRVFEPFYRVKGNETQGGQPSSGLGLALVKGLVDAMGGQISFQSRVGGGSTFTVRLPTSATTNNNSEEERDASSGSLREAAR